MKQTTEKVYRCDHCNKAMVSAGLMKAHERMCKENPNNKHKCFEYCKNLIKEQNDITDEYCNYCGYAKISFTCKKRPGVELYSYKLERYKSKQKRLENMERMPLECDLYEDEGNIVFQECDLEDFEYKTDL